MIKNSGKIYDVDLPEDREEMEQLLDELDSQEAEENMAHLKETINKIEESLKIIQERNFSEMSDKEIEEVAEVVLNLNKFKLQFDMLVDSYLGQGALTQTKLPFDVGTEPPAEFPAWGAKKPGDPEFGLYHPTLPLAEASMENDMLKELVKIANELDNRGLTKEADELDKITKGLTKEASLCLMLLSGLIGCKKSVEEKVWGTDTEDPQPITFDALDSEGYVIFDQNDFAAKGQSAFLEGCVKKMEWIYEISDSVKVNDDGTVLWKYVDGHDPVLRAIYPVLEDGNYDVLFKLGDTDRDGETCHLSLTVVEAGTSGGYSRTETY